MSGGDARHLDLPATPPRREPELDPAGITVDVNDEDVRGIRQVHNNIRVARRDGGRRS
jgi:hypothetical protein